MFLKENHVTILVKWPLWKLERGGDVTWRGKIGYKLKTRELRKEVRMSELNALFHTFPGLVNRVVVQHTTNWSVPETKSSFNEMTVDKESNFYGHNFWRITSTNHFC